jgi:hypothetical protein
MNADARQLLETSAEYLRVISSALRLDGDVNAPGAARDAFLAAQSKWMNQEGGQERVVPISTLFYSDGSRASSKPRRILRRQPRIASISSW